MTERLPVWRFVALWLIGIVAATGYLAGNIPWDKVL